MDAFGSRIRAGQELEQHDDDLSDSTSTHQHQVQSLGSSLSLSDAGNLHASQRLQSTPRVKTASSTTTSGHLHRVYRSSGRPVTVSSSATATDSSVSLSSGDGEELEDDDHPDAINDLVHQNNKNAMSNNNLPAREYWNRIILDIESNEAAFQPDRRPTSSHLQYLAPTIYNNAPSTGSSTLVEHDGGRDSAMQGKAVSSRQASPPTSRTSPSNNHASRFAAAVSYAADLEESQRDLSNSSSGNRSLTPQPSSFHNTTEPSTEFYEGTSEVASRVHDIFKRHIHNASTSYTSRRRSTNTNTRELSESKQRPRQRLRDLLETSPRQSAASERANTSVHRQHRNAEADLPNANVTASSRVHPVHNQNLIYQSAYSQQPLDSVPSGRQAKPSYPSYTQSQEDNREEDRKPHSARHVERYGRLSQEWRDISQRAAVTDAYQNTFVDGVPQSETEEDGASDSDVEGHRAQAHTDVRHRRSHSEIETSRHLNAPVTGFNHASVSDAEAVEGDEEEDKYSLILEDVTPDEHEMPELHTPKSLPRNKTTPASGETPSGHNGSPPQHTSPAASRHTPESRLPTSPSPRRVLRHSQSLFSNSSVSATPPKTPHLPGHYLSTTPFTRMAPVTTAARTPGRAVKGSRDLPDDRSRHPSDSTLMLPAIPGGYTSPFPHPRQTLLSEKHLEPPAKAPSSSTSQFAEDRRKTDRFSTMLHRVIEEADAERRTVRAQSPSRRSRQTSSELAPFESPSRKNSRLSPSSQSKRDVEETSDYMHGPPSATDAEDQTSSLHAAENTLQTLLVDLVKPLKGLIGGFETPSASLGSPNDIAPDDSEATMVSNQSFEHRLQQRRKTRSEQDAMLRKLQQADSLDHSLVNKAEEFKVALEDMGNRFTTQVSCVLNETFAKENRKRKLWFLFLLLAELSLLWAIFSLANARANLLYQTTYFDPFSPELYEPVPLPHLAEIYSPSLSSASPLAAADASYQSWPLIKTVTAYFRTSSNSFASFLPLGPNIPNYDDSIISRQYTLSDGGVRTYVYQFVSIIRSLYHQLLSLGLGTSSFAHGTLGGAAIGSRSQVYKVPT